MSFIVFLIYETTMTSVSFTPNLPGLTVRSAPVCNVWDYRAGLTGSRSVNKLHKQHMLHFSAIILPFLMQLHIFSAVYQHFSGCWIWIEGCCYRDFVTRSPVSIMANQQVLTLNHKLWAFLNFHLTKLFITMNDVSMFFNGNIRISENLAILFLC